MKRNYVILTCLLLGLGKFNSEAQTQEKPNIIFILSDDHAYQAISAYGSQLVNTPRIQVEALQPEIKKLKLRLNELIDQYEDTEAAEVLRQEKKK
ncbi:hypothetical protein KO02_22060 [Sphingobacterium sp. ML3W]|uniref:hypothetical protein n=1 Tax=Sphingobacterium sp. ML3W TaxID=1538644 RepID=UPI0004F5E303|nr:hypothetical protein [Sphingobacterium sp. ML3W]AIM39070.1 hypothetical protein KO02_22060 [Sphingobacterium sp. ML3W]